MCLRAEGLRPHAISESSDACELAVAHLRPRAIIRGSVLSRVAHGLGQVGSRLAIAASLVVFVANVFD